MTTTDAAALWAAIEATPWEDAPKLMLADWYYEDDLFIKAFLNDESQSA